jgi:hypothetical protein
MWMNRWRLRVDLGGMLGKSGLVHDALLVGCRRRLV